MNFRYFKPGSVGEAIYLKKEYKNSKYVAGGTDIFVLIKKKAIKPDALISLRNLNEIKGIEENEEFVFIGAGTTLRELEQSEVVRKYFPALYDALINMASVQIRNVGTIGGNIVNASPGADTASPLLIYDAKVVIIMDDFKERELPLDEFFKGPKQVFLAEEEIVKGFLLKKPVKNSGSAYYKFMKRNAMDLANAGVAMNIKIGDDDIIEDIKVGLTTVAPTPIRATGTEEFLIYKKFSEEILEQAGNIAKKECSPIDDIRGKEWHKREIVKAYIRRVGMIAYKRAKLI